MAWKKWAGGRCYIAPGIRVYHIYKMRNGRRYSASTKCSDERAALREYERWQQDPEGYRPLGGEERLLLTDVLIDRFVEAGKRSGNGEGRLWKKRHYMAWWKERLSGDLRKATLAQLNAHLDGVNDRGNPTNVLKAFWSFLLQGGLATENPAQHLKMPPVRPAQLDRSKVIDEDDHQAVVDAIDRKWGDLLVVLSGTGWHISELERFAESGDTRVLDREGVHLEKWRDRAPFVLTTSHKSGDFHQTAVSGEVWAKARKVRRRGKFNRTLFYRAVRKCCQKLGIEPFAPGQYRHTIATNAIEGGTAPEAVSAFLGHKSTATTKRFYAVHAIRPKIPTLT